MHFINFWPDFFNPGSPANIEILQDLFLAPLKNTDLSVGSVFGSGTGQNVDYIDLLFSGECPANMRTEGDLFRYTDSRYGNYAGAKWFIGIPKLNHSRAFWLPLYYLYWAHYRSHVQRPKISLSEREFGISVVIGNMHSGSLTKVRADLAHNLSLFVPVHANRALQKTAPAHSMVTYHDVPDKLEFISRFTHHLCFENTAHPGYLTEKIFDSFYSGAVPLYSGDVYAGQWFDQESFIDCTGAHVLDIVWKIHHSRELQARIHQEREGLCYIPLDEMIYRTHGFCRELATHLIR